MSRPARAESPCPRRGRGGRSLRAGWLRRPAGWLRRPVGWLAALLLVAACAEPAPPTLTVRGVYVEPQFDGQAALVDHEAIPGRMDAMQMGMRVQDPGAFDGIAPGTAVRLTLDSASLAVVAAEPLPAGTPLDLAP